jgi:radical SAM superfamily enzyme YgiQ (UPF0313 family)
MARQTLLLVCPPVLYATTWWANRIANKPHIASLAGYVRDLADVRVLELDGVSGFDANSWDRLAEALAGSVGLVGISCWTSLHYLGALATAERVRQIAPHVPIVVGGHHPTAAPGDFNDTNFDWLVRGDGEQALRTLCAQWPSRPSLMTVIEGGVFRQGNPDDIDWAEYCQWNEGDRAIWAGMSRGCPFKCRYCIEPQRGPSFSGYNVNDALAIVETLVRSRKPRVIAFSDPLFGVNRQWTEGFLDGVLERDLPVMFWAETRADLMTPALLDRFKRCNFMLDFGLDTASEAMVERMEKAGNPQLYLARSREVLEHANRIGLNHGIYIVFNFPGETPQTTRETQDFIDGLAVSGPMSGWLSCQTFFILPGTQAFTQMAGNARTYGTRIRHPGWWRETGDHHALATDVLPSASWAGREDELRRFIPWNHEVNARWSARYPSKVRQFRHNFYVA